MSKFRTSQLHIVNIDIATFSVIEKDAVKDDSIKFSLKNANIGYSMEKKLLRVSLCIEIEGKCDGEFEVDTIFKVDNLEEIIDLDKNEISSEELKLGNHAIAIAFSTLRGIVYTKTLGTILNGLILPIVDPQQLFKDMLKGEVKKELA